MQPNSTPSSQNSPQTPTPASLQVSDNLTVMQPDEVLICEIKRHPFGMIGLQITAGILLLVAAMVVFGVLPHVLTDTSMNTVIGFGALGFIVLAAAVFGFLAISHRVYYGNRWILTSDSLTQVSQLTLFNRQSSQLSLANLEDISAEQNGILSHMFNFGAIKVETAGEHSKFYFTFCPNPNYYAQQILQAREVFEQGRMGLNATAAAPTPTGYSPGVNSHNVQ